MLKILCRVDAGGELCDNFSIPEKRSLFLIIFQRHHPRIGWLNPTGIAPSARLGLGYACSRKRGGEWGSDDDGRRPVACVRRRR
jgi:hypothetical protein